MIVFNWPIGKVYGFEAVCTACLLKVRGHSRVSGHTVWQQCLQICTRPVYTHFVVTFGVGVLTNRRNKVIFQSVASPCASRVHNERNIAAIAQFYCSDYDGSYMFRLRKVASSGCAYLKCKKGKLYLCGRTYCVQLSTVLYCK
jgi:hypothetical protein